jgi:membrane fusion protein, multidrug efflux system
MYRQFRSAVPAAVVVITLFGSCSENNTGNNANMRPPVRVEVAQPERMTIASTLVSSGTIASRNEVRVIAQTEGMVTMIELEEGDRVREGDVLIRLDDSIPRAQYREAEAGMREARRNLERAQQLYERNLIAEQEYQTIVAQAEIAESRYEYRRALFEYTTIRAPISGVITYRGVDQGDIASQRDLLLTITNLDELVIRVSVSELEAPFLSRGDAVRVHVDAYRDTEFTGSIRRIFPAADPDTRLIPVEVQLTERDERLFPGLFARAEFQTQRSENALTIPAQAVQTSPQGDRFVFTVNDESAHYRRIVTGLRSDMHIEVIEGLQENENVVIRGAASLRDGTPVQRITTEQQGAYE